MNRPKLCMVEASGTTSRVDVCLGARFDVTRVTKGLTDSERARLFADYDVLWIKLGYRWDQAIFNAVKQHGQIRARLLALPATGSDHIDIDAAAELGIDVQSLRGETSYLKNVRATAELAIALALELARPIHPAISAVQNGVFRREDFFGRELFGKTVGIIGMGRLGSLAAKYFGALGLRVLGYDPHAKWDSDLAERREELLSLLKDSDIVSLHASQSDETKNLLGRESFQAMKEGVWFINTARGGIVDEVALIEAMRTGHVARAALDVIWGEPNPTKDTSPALAALSELYPRLLITPHLGGNTLESVEKAELHLATLILDRAL